MKEIIGTILSMQIVINLFLFTVTFPANISNYVQKLKPIISFNILKVLTQVTQDFINLDLNGQAQIREKIITPVRDLGTKSHNAIPNLGNMFHLLFYYLFCLVYLSYLKFMGITDFKAADKHIKLRK